MSEHSAGRVGDDARARTDDDPVTAANMGAETPPPAPTESADDPWARVGKALASGNRTRRDDVAALHREVERLRLLTHDGDCPDLPDESDGYEPGYDYQPDGGPWV